MSAPAPVSPRISSPVPLTLTPLRRRGDFVRVQKSPLRWVTPGFVVVCEPSAGDLAAPLQIGFTITKKIGNAVLRNRVRRRFRHLTREILPALPLLSGWTVVLLARPDAAIRDYAALGKDLRWALRKLQAQLPSSSASSSARDATTFS